MKYYIDITTNEVYKKVGNTCTNISRKDAFDIAIKMELPEDVIELKPVIKRYTKLLFLTKNPFKNIKLYFNNELNLFIQSKNNWGKVCIILKYNLGIPLVYAKQLMDKKIKNNEKKL